MLIQYISPKNVLLDSKILKLSTIALLVIAL